MNTTKNGKDQSSTLPKGLQPWWRLRIFHGLPLSIWIKISRNHLASADSLYLFISITLASFLNSFLNTITKILFNKKINKAVVRDDPLFIIGHWRSGTTLTHELLSLDPNNKSPSTYQCFAAGHFLTTICFMPWFLRWLIPDKRPMDGVSVGWSHPQEDEFALLILGAPSPYSRIAFPRDAPQRMEALDLDLLSEPERNDWKRRLHHFASCLSINSNRRLIFKSPTHTARIRILLELFPNARFLHIVRDPVAVFRSSQNLWLTLYNSNGLQIYKDEISSQFIIENFEQMYAAYYRDLPLISPRRIHHMRYEDLVYNPVTCLKEAYHSLELGDFSLLEINIQENLTKLKSYIPTKYDKLHEVSHLKSAIWKRLSDEHGYS